MKTQFKSDFKLERNLRIATDYLSGMPLKEIQDRYKISRQRIFQILKRFNKEIIEEKLGYTPYDTMG